MTWYGWLGEVVRLARQRGITARWVENQPGWATFTWRCDSGPSNGVAGAGVEMIHLTTPAAFIEYWRCAPAAVPPLVEIGERQLGPDKYKRRIGRYVPFIPARATWMAVQELFS